MEDKELDVVEVFELKSETIPYRYIIMALFALIAAYGLFSGFTQLLIALFFGLIVLIFSYALNFFNQENETRNYEEIYEKLNYIKQDNNINLPLNVPDLQQVPFKIINEARPYIKEIETVALGASGIFVENLHQMIDIIEKIIVKIEKEPEGFNIVQRLFTFYIPQTANLLRARGSAVRADDIKKVEEIEHMISRINLAFNEFNNRLYSVQSNEIAIDLKLLDQSLNSEFPFDDNI